MADPHAEASHSGPDAPKPDPQQPLSVQHFQPGWSTGDHSNMAGRDQHFYYGANPDGDSVAVDISDAQPSRVTTRSSGIIAGISSAITIGTFAWTVVAAVRSWSAARPAAELPAIATAVASTLGTALPIFLVCVGMGLLTAAAWRFFLARKKGLPVYYRRRSLRRPLIPLRSQPGRFVRARVSAECAECRADHRPGEMGKLYRTRQERDGIVSYRCRYQHVSRFRGRSCFAD